MRLLSIVPIARGIRKETLTYFSTKDIEAGALVTMPLRKKEIPGIVLESIDAMQNKSAIKDMDFTIRKITDYDNKVSLPPFVMKAAAKIADLSATSIGGVLAAIIPKLCFENPKSFFTKQAEDIQPDTQNNFEVVVIQSSNEERMDTYRSIVRESFAKKKSIAIICPTEQKVLELKDLLSKGIPDYTLTLSKTTSKKLLEEFTNKITTDTHPLLIIGTSYVLPLLQKTIGTLILEEESSPYYKSRRRPFLDTRMTMREIAKAMNIRLIFGDKLLSVQTLAELREGYVNEYARIDRRNTYKVQTLLVDTKQKEGEKKSFEVLSPDLKEMILYSAKNNKKILVYATRRGVSSQTVCNDCGTTVICDNCESPVVLHTIKEKRIYLCHHCGKTKDADRNCSVCQSWNLVPLGIGIEKMEEEIKKLGDIQVARIDSDTCKSMKEAKEKMNEFYSTDTVLVTTDLGLQFVRDLSVNYVALPALDSMFSLPDFRTTERIMHTILDLKTKATDCILVQARNNKHPVIEQALAGDLESFVNDEVKARKDFGYAPYMTIIKLSVEDKKERVKFIANDVVAKLTVYSPILFPAFIKSKKGYSTLNILIKIERSKWPDKELLDILLSFPPNIRIDTTPISLL